MGQTYQLLEPDQLAQGSIGGGGVLVGCPAEKVSSSLGSTVLQEEAGSLQVVVAAGKHERRQAIVSAGSIHSSAASKQLTHYLHVA